MRSKLLSAVSCLLAIISLPSEANSMVRAGDEKSRNALAEKVADFGYANKCREPGSLAQLSTEIRHDLLSDARFSQLEKRYPGLADASIEAAKANFSAILASLRPELIRIAAKYASDSFSADELREVSDFLQSPSGQVLACPPADIINGDGQIVLAALPSEQARAIADFRASGAGRRFEAYSLTMARQTPAIRSELLTPYQAQMFETIVSAAKAHIAKRGN